MRHNFKRVISLALVLAFLVMALPFGLLVNAEGEVDITKGLKGYYTFDDGSGTKAKDESGNNFDGDIGFTPKWTDGKVGGALEFDGTADVTVSGDILKSASANKQFTIAYWIKPAKVTGEVGLVGKNRIRCKLTEKGYINGLAASEWGENDEAGNNSAYGTEWVGATAELIKFDEWNHVVLQYDAEKKVCVYINGTPQLKWGPKPFYEIADGGKLHIGDDDSKKYFKGLMDDVRIYDRALNDDEIQALVKYQPPILAPKVNAVDDNDKVVTGTAQKGLNVVVRLEGEDIGTAKVGNDGKYSVTISPRKAGTVLEVIAQNENFDEGPAASVTIVDKTAPAKPKVSTVTSKSTSVTGTAEKGATITVKAGNKTLGTAKVASNGKFSVKIKAQKAKTSLSVTAKDSVGNVSKPAKVTVK